MHVGIRWHGFLCVEVPHKLCLSAPGITPRNKTYVQVYKYVQVCTHIQVCSYVCIGLYTYVRIAIGIYIEIGYLNTYV